ncbi:MFS transporter [Candidatus Fermentibacterales bacterium]|nr:MFS transporter [Candidatus Fermentibacterales bacterium]
MSGALSESGYSDTGGRSYRDLPGSVWALGFVSMFMDISSELVHSLLPLLMATLLGASMFTIGMIEGAAEAVAAITKVFSGALSDRLGRRKPLAVAGYSLAAFTKPVFPLATSIGWVFGARFTDRIGKGIRGAPRDALIADITRPGLRGAAYGLRQALDSLGALIGPLLAILLMLWLSDDIRAVLWVAVVPAAVAVVVLVALVREPGSSKPEHGSGSRLTLASARLLPLRYWLVVALGGVFTLARFSEAFLILRALDVGLRIGLVPLIMVAMNLVYSAASYPAGIAADRLPARTLLLAGLTALVAADVVLAIAGSPLAAMLGAAFGGLHMALTQGLLSKLVADASPVEMRGTAFGVFNLVSGAALLLASVIAGALWSGMGPRATFVAGASFAALAAAGLLLYGRTDRAGGGPATPRERLRSRACR